MATKFVFEDNEAGESLIMRRKVVYILMVVVMSVSMLSACGNEKDVLAEQPQVTEASETGTPTPETEEPKPVETDTPDSTTKDTNDKQESVALPEGFYDTDWTTRYETCKDMDPSTITDTYVANRYWEAYGVYEAAGYKAEDYDGVMDMMYNFMKDYDGGGDTPKAIRNYAKSQGAHGASGSTWYYKGKNGQHSYAVNIVTGEKWIAGPNCYLPSGENFLGYGAENDWNTYLVTKHLAEERGEGDVIGESAGENPFPGETYDWDSNTWN